MTRRWPLILSLMPLLLGLAVYGQVWRGWAADFETTLAGWLPGQRPAVGGFPYRLEAELAGAGLRHDGAATLAMAAARLRLNRGPWRPELTVMQGQGIRLNAGLGALAASADAASGTASLHLVDGRLARLSIVLPGASGSTGFGPAFRADRLELHGRERLPGAAADASRPQPRGQLVVGATGLRLGAGAAISLSADATIMGNARLGDYDRWSGTGSIDLTLVANDAAGEVARLAASIVPLGRRLRLAGTITTVCPLSVQALLASTVPPAEARLRAPVRLSLETALPAGGAAALSGIPADLATRARRRQLPACPRLG